MAQAEIRVFRLRTIIGFADDFAALKMTEHSMGNYWPRWKR